MKDVEGTRLNICKLSPPFSLDHIQDVGKAISQGTEKTIVGNFVDAAVGGAWLNDE